MVSLLEYRKINTYIYGLVIAVLLALPTTGQVLLDSGSHVGLGFYEVNKAHIKTVPFQNNFDSSILLVNAEFVSNGPLGVSIPFNSTVETGGEFLVDFSLLSYQEGVFIDTLVISFRSWEQLFSVKIAVSAIFLKSAYDLESTVLLPSGAGLNDYRLISIPGQPVALFSVLKESLGQAGKDRWRAFLWEDGWKECTASDMFNTRSGFFLIHQTSQKHLTIKELKPLMTKADTIILHPGWNLVRNSYLNAVDSKYIKLTSGENFQLFTYQGSWSLVNQMLPWLGYAIFCEHADTLIVDGYHAYLQPESHVDIQKPAGQIVVSSHKGIDSCLYIASPEKPRMLRKPPSVMNGIYAYFLHHSKALSVIPGSMVDSVLLGIVTSAGENITVQFCLPQASDSLWCLTTPKGEQFNFKTRFMLEFQSISDTNFCILRKVRQTQRLSETTAGLEVNASPNPFNSILKISVNMAKNQRVSINILNVLGQKIKTVYDGYLHSDQSVFIWNGIDDKGEPVPTGMYFLSVTSAQNTIFRKILLLK